jgi:hypothetical protein
MCLCVPFIWRSHSFGKSFLFLFLFFVLSVLRDYPSYVVYSTITYYLRASHFIIHVFKSVLSYKNRFVTQYITYLNIWGALSRTFSSLSTHDWLVLVWKLILKSIEHSRPAPTRILNRHQSVMGWQWGKSPWKPSSYIQVMIKNILKWREESDTYLTCVCRHCWSRKISLRVDGIGAFSCTADESHSVGWKLLFHLLSLKSFCSSDVYRRESGMCRSPPFILIYSSKWCWLVGMLLVSRSRLVKEDAV